MNLVSDSVVEQTKQVMCVCVCVTATLTSRVCYLRLPFTNSLQALTNMKHVLEAANSDIASGKLSQLLLLHCS